MIDRNAELAVKMARVVRTKFELGRAHDRADNGCGHAEQLAFSRATDAYSAANEELRAAIADFPPDQQKDLWAQVDRELKKPKSGK
jgi:hypothetical protein